VSVCPSVCDKVEASDERIDTDRLKVRDKISFYSDVVLFEDELHDSGCSVLSVKIVRSMPLVYLFSSDSEYMLINVFSVIGVDNFFLNV